MEHIMGNRRDVAEGILTKVLERINRLHREKQELTIGVNKRVKISLCKIALEEKFTEAQIERFFSNVLVAVDTGTLKSGGSSAVMLDLTELLSKAKKEARAMN
jgi:hypothetical protein